MKLLQSLLWIFFQASIIGEGSTFWEYNIATAYKTYLELKPIVNPIKLQSYIQII